MPDLNDRINKLFEALDHKQMFPDFTQQLRTVIPANTDVSIPSKKTFNQQFKDIPEALFVHKSYFSVESFPVTRTAQLFRSLRSVVNESNNDKYIDTLHYLYQRIFALQKEASSPGLASAFKMPIDRKVQALQDLIAYIKSLSEQTTSIAFYIAIVMWENQEIDENRERTTYRSLLEKRRLNQRSSSSSANLLDALKGDLITQAKLNQEISVVEANTLQHAMDEKIEKSVLLNFLNTSPSKVSTIFLNVLKFFTTDINQPTDFSNAIQRMIHEKLNTDETRLEERKSFYQSMDQHSGEQLHSFRESITVPRSPSTDSSPTSSNAYSFSKRASEYIEDQLVLRGEKILKKNQHAQKKKEELGAIRGALILILQTEKISPEEKIKKANSLFNTESNLLDGSFSIHDQSFFSETCSLTITGRHLRNLRNYINSYNTDIGMFEEIKNDRLIETLHALYQRLSVLQREQSNNKRVNTDAHLFVSLSDEIRSSSNTSTESPSDPPKQNTLSKKIPPNAKIEALQNLINTIKNNADKTTPRDFYDVITQWEKSNSSLNDNLKKKRSNRLFQPKHTPSIQVIKTLKSDLLKQAVKNGQMTLEEMKSLAQEEKLATQDTKTMVYRQN